MRHYPASNLTSGHPNSLQQVKPKGATDWTSLINDELAYVMDNGTLRIYKFVAASVLAESSPDVIIPDGNATGTGRWEQQEFASGAAAPTVNRFFSANNLAVGEYEGDLWTNQTIAFGSNTFPGYLLRKRSDGQWVDAIATVEGGVVGRLGLSMDTGTGSGKNILVRGCANLFSVNDGGFDAGTNGAPIYASETSGLMSHLEPTGLGAQVRIVGYKINNFIIDFDPSPTWIQIVGTGGEG